MDNRWRQLDKFESSVKQYADTKTTWRRKLNAKEGELEAAKVNRSLREVFYVLTRGVDNAIRPDLAAGHIEAAYARRLERGQGTHDPREQRGASLGQCPESAGGRRGEDGRHEPENYCGR